MKSKNLVSVFVVYTLRAIVLGSALFLSCAPPKKVVHIRPSPIPPLTAKIYESPGIDWSKYQNLKIELREVGKPDTASNQILERYLLKQTKDCFNRKGYLFNDSGYSAVVRVFFGIKEEKVISTNTLAYGLSGGMTSGLFYENYELGSQVWHTAGLAITAWGAHSIQQSIPIYEGEITIELFDRTGANQLWRGDIRAPLSSDDIRLASNQMIREVLWYLPALDYPAVWVPEVPAEEFDRFWTNFVEKQEFYSPGQKFPVKLDYRYYPTGKNLRVKHSGEKRNTKALNEAAAAFAETAEYQRVRDKEYGQAFHKFIFSDWNRKWAMNEFKKFDRSGVAIADLLMTAPWSIKSQDTIRVAGRYMIGSDSEPTYVMIQAGLMTYRLIETPTINYEYKRFFIYNISVISLAEFYPLWQESNDYRDTVFGWRIDYVPDEPTPVNDLNQG